MLAVHSVATVCNFPQKLHFGSFTHFTNLVDFKLSISYCWMTLTRLVINYNLSIVNHLMLDMIIVKKIASLFVDQLDQWNFVDQLDHLLSYMIVHCLLFLSLNHNNMLQFYVVCRFLIWDPPNTRDPDSLGTAEL